MIHLPIMCWLLVAVLLLGSLRVGLLRAIIREVTFFATTETLAGGARGTSLHRSVVGRSLSWCLLTTLLLRMLITNLLLVWVALRILTMIPLIGSSLKPLLEALLRVGTLTSIAPRGLSLKPPLLGLHLLALVVNNNSAIH